MYLFIQTENINHANLFLITQDSQKTLDRMQFECYQNLAEILLGKVISFLKKSNLQLSDLKGVAVFSGPGSFTNLRISHTLANTLAYSLEIPVVNAQGSSWQDKCYQALTSGENYRIIKPDYGHPPNITKPIK